MESRRLCFVLIFNLVTLFLEINSNTWVPYSRDPHQSECFVTDFRHYCRAITVDDSRMACTAEGSWSSSMLKSNDITADDLVRWNIPFHLIEQYVAYLSGVSSTESIFCNCTQDRLGNTCQYELPRRVKTPSEWLNQQLNGMNLNDQETLTSFVDGITCQGDAELLEWRHICDGIIQCQNGLDETDCHLLEYHRCERDEFQCRNGMCIPIEFVFDAMPDCMDSSDEQELDELNRRYYECAIRSVLDCDDRLCRKDQFSCGNGDCISWSAVLDNGNECANLRHVAYLCETSETLVNRYQEWFGICRQTTPPLPPLTKASSCHSSLRHLLNIRTTRQSRELAFTNIIGGCSELIPYLGQSVLSSNLKLFYNRSQIEWFYKNGSNFHRAIPRTPHLYCFVGQIACPELLWINFSRAHCMDYEQLKELTVYPFPPLSHLLCQLIMSRTSRHIGKNSDQRSSIPLAWYECRNTSDRLSLRRVNDGYIDCLYGDDEKNGDYPLIEPFRYQCQTVSSRSQYVSYAKLGNSISECTDGSDEISQELRWTSFKCDVSDNFACWILQGGRATENRIRDVRLHFSRYCDSVWDTMDGRDEMNCSQWICGRGLHQCNRTGQCIDRTHLCDGEFDCSDGEDELRCPPRSRRWILERQCNETTEYFCITDQYLTNRTLYRPCIAFNQVGDRNIDCLGARDQRNVVSCPDHRTLGDRFMCDNQTNCIEYRAVCNGIDDCLDRTDESICFWNRSGCLAGQFACANAKICTKGRCSSTDGCPDRSHWLWCPNSTAEHYHYRSSKDIRFVDNKESCYSQSAGQAKHVMAVLPLDLIVKSNVAPVRIHYQYCNRGFYLLANNRTELRCFCPQSFYGDRCQFSSRRITVRIRFDRWHRSDLPIVLDVLVMLVRNASEIVDYQFFSDENKEYPSKSNAYLIYSRPKLPGFYSLRIEAYHLTNLIHFWEYPVTPLDFLPVLRLAKILRFPDRPLPWPCTDNYCRNNGTCYQRENDRYMCLCPRHWKGRLCEIQIARVNCALQSFARTENICLCPHGYLQPHCFVPNLKCRQTQCPLNEICFPLSTPPIHRHMCVCNTSNCKSDRPVVVVHRQVSNTSPFLIQLLQLSHDYPTVRQQILIQPFSNFPLVQTIKTRDYRTEMGRLPELGLLFTFAQQAYSVESALYLLFINCSNAPRNYTIDLDRQQHRCDVLLESERHSLTLFRRFCLESTNSSCFLFTGYLCYCHIPHIGQSDCLSYAERYTRCIYCHNQGYCVQGDLTNRSDFTCVCPACVTGILCQFSQSRFSISLEFLIENASWGRYNFIGPILFFFVGMVFNGLSMMTFGQRKLRQTGVSLHLLATCICSQLVLLFLCARVIYLYITRRVWMLPEINKGLCKSLPFLVYTFYYISLWLMAFVTVERAAGAIQFSCWSSLQKPTTATLFILFISIITLSSNYIYIYQYQLVTHSEESFSWCVREIQSNEQFLTQSLSLLHRLIPFLINIIAALSIIVAITRSKAHAHQITTRSILIDQTRKRLDLLLGPIACFLTQMPEIIILFLNSCDYNTTKWFVHVTLITYYLSFAPHFSLFFLYVLPSKVYQDVFLTKTSLGIRLCKIRQLWSEPVKHKL